MVGSEPIKAELNDLFSNEREFERKIGSTKNKLQRFIHPHMRRIMGLRENNIDVPALIEGKRDFFANLQPSPTLLVSGENTRTFGLLAVSEVWEYFAPLNKPHELYLVVDEMQEIMPIELLEVLPQAAKRGLHCILVHQDMGQLTPEFVSAMRNAQTKITFSTEQSPKEQRHFTLRRTNHDTVNVIAPLVPARFITQQRIDAFVEYHTQHYFTPEEVDARLNQKHNEVREEPELTYEDFLK